MNISRIINNAKEKIDSYQQRSVNKKALQLEGLRKERIKKEERVKIVDSYNKEKEKLNKANSKLRENNSLNTIKKELEKRKKNKEKSNNSLDFGMGKNPFN